jgi:PTH1 family peptidyl-tRNA hydrolase
MKLVVGLGNIGSEYQHTNHNAGFEVLDIVAEKLNFNFNKRGCDADYAEYKTFDEKFIFAKPRTYMNESGKSVKSFLSKFKLETTDVIVISDDIDLEPGKIRVRKSGSAGTHNGLKSIIRETGKEDFARIRVGIGGKHEGQDLADFVLSKMKMSDAQKQGLEKAADAVLAFVSGETADAVMTKFNGDSEKNGKH